MGRNKPFVTNIWWFEQNKRTILVLGNWVIIRVSQTLVNIGNSISAFRLPFWLCCANGSNFRQTSRESFGIASYFRNIINYYCALICCRLLPVSLKSGGSVFGSLLGKSGFFGWLLKHRSEVQIFVAGALGTRDWLSEHFGFNSRGHTIVTCPISWAYAFLTFTASQSFEHSINI